MIHLVELKKAHVASHARIDSRSGKMEMVREYDDSRTKHFRPPAAKPHRLRPGFPPITEDKETEQAAQPMERPKEEPKAGLSLGEDKVWKNPDGSSVSDEDHARLKALRVPPAWTNVQLNPDHNAPLQVKGTDAKGRTQYLYSAAHSEKAAAEKFARLKDFHAVIPKIREAALKDMNNKKISQEKRDTAACMYLIYKTGFRIGSDTDTRADKKAFGASTLLRNHVKVSGDQVEFNFTGKKGVQQHHVIQDPVLAKYLAKPKNDQRLFRTSDTAVRDYLKSVSRDDFKVKDFRTYHGTAKALEVINGHPIPSEDKAFVKFQKSVAKEVSSHLGNTPDMALKAYIDPSVWRR